MPLCTVSSITILPLAPHATKTVMQFPWRVYRGDHLWVPPLLASNMRDFQAEVARITAMYNDAWSNNWGFVPMTDAEAQHLAQDLRFAVIPAMALAAELDGDLVGCFIALPDLNRSCLYQKDLV